MAFSDLREFVAHLERHGRLRRISVPVSRDLEITEIVDRVSKTRGEGNVALLFERVEDFEMPLLVNAFGSEQRMAHALGVERLDDVGERIAKLLDLRLPGSFLDKLKKLGTLLDVAKAAPRRVGHAPCQEVVETTNPSLATLPALTCWPGDGGRYITLPAVFTRDPATGARNVGMYRLQIFDDRTLGMHWQLHKGGAEHQHKALIGAQPGPVSNRPPSDRAGHAAPAPEGGAEHQHKALIGAQPAPVSNRPPPDRAGHAAPAPEGGAEHQHKALIGAQPGPATTMPVAIALGGDPALMYAASAPLPPGIDEVVFAGWLRGAGVELVRCRTLDVAVPAQAELVLVG